MDLFGDGNGSKTLETHTLPQTLTVSNKANPLNTQVVNTADLAVYQINSTKLRIVYLFALKDANDTDKAVTIKATDGNGDYLLEKTYKADGFIKSFVFETETDTEITFTYSIPASTDAAEPEIFAELTQNRVLVQTSPLVDCKC